MRVIEGLQQGRGRQGGFSYLWVLLITAFMGVGLTIAAEVDATMARRDRERELIAVGRQFRTAIGRYYELQKTAGRGEYPSSLEDLLKDNRVPGVRRHLRRIFIDPMTAKAEWGLVKIGGRIVGVHSLSEQAPIKQSGFEPEEVGLAGKTMYSEWVFTYPADLTMQPASLGDSPGVPLDRNGAHQPNPTLGPILQEVTRP